MLSLFLHLPYTLQLTPTCLLPTGPLKLLLSRLPVTSLEQKFKKQLASYPSLVWPLSVAFSTGFQLPWACSSLGLNGTTCFTFSFCRSVTPYNTLLLHLLSLTSRCRNAQGARVGSLVLSLSAFFPSDSNHFCSFRCSLHGDNSQNQIRSLILPRLGELTASWVLHPGVHRQLNLSTS